MQTNLERELDQLRMNLVEMMELVLNQLDKSRIAFEEQDVALAKEIRKLENRVNAADLSIDRDCENIIALYNPVAGDLRFVLAVTKIVAHLERIGDHAEKISKYVRKKQIAESYDKKLLKMTRFRTMFDTAIEMTDIAIQAFTQESSSLARQVFGKDILINEIYRETTEKINRFAKKREADVESLLYLFSIINKLERVGDLATNIAEETIFYLDANILRHKKIKKQIQDTSEKQ